MSILGKAALLTTTTPQPSKHRRNRSGKFDLPKGQGRAPSFVAIRRDSQEPGAPHLVSGLGLALSAQQQQHGDGEIEHEDDDDEDQDQGDYINPHDDDDDEDRLSFSPETIMSRLGGMMGRRDLVKERKLGPRSGEDGKVWKVFHEAGGGVQGRSSGAGEDEVRGGYGAGGSTFTTGTAGTTSRPTLSQTLSEYLSLLYTILPLNLVAFLSDPARFLDNKETGIRCPFEAAGGWRDVWKQGELGRILSVSETRASLVVRVSLISERGVKGG
jgi:hypothetical protein